MDTAAQSLAVRTRRVVGLQGGIGALAGAAFFLAAGPWEGLSAAYGAAVSLVLTLFLSRGVMRAGEAARTNPKGSQLILYLGAAARFVLVLVVFAWGLAGLKLAPMPMVIGFVAAQLAFLVAAARRSATDA